MLLQVLCGSPLAAVLPSLCVPGFQQLLGRQAPRAACYHAHAVANVSTPADALLDPLAGLPHGLAAPHSCSTPKISKELLRYSTHFPEALYGQLAGLVASRPFPTAVDMSCAAPGTAGAELGRRGFRVAEAFAAAPSSCGPHRLPGGCSDVVTVLPGPRELHAPELLAEARRLMAAGGYLAVAWNDRDLASPFVCDLEALLEQINPHYCRSSRQHNPPAVLSALSDGGALALHSYSSWAHSLTMARAGVLQDLLGGFAVVRPYLAASSTHRKAFHQAVRDLVRRHFGVEEAPFELPITTKLYVMTHAPGSAAASTTATTATTAAAVSGTAAGSDAHYCSSAGAANDSSSSEGGGCEDADGATDSGSSSSSSSSGTCGCCCTTDDGCMTHHVRTRRSGLSSRDSCTLRHLYA